MSVVPSPFFAEPVCRSFNPVKGTWCSGLVFKADPCVCVCRREEDAGGEHVHVGLLETVGGRKQLKNSMSIPAPVF